MEERSRGEATLEIVTEEGFEETVDVLAEAFFDYPVMRWVIGDAGADYASRLRRLVGFFTRARFVRRDLVLAVVEEGRMVAAANINLPRESLDDSSDEKDPLEEYRHDVWEDLGADARGRYEAYGVAAGRSPFPVPHYHLGMIGVRRKNAGCGHAKRLLDYLHRVSADDPESLGVSLATEKRKNLSLYEHFGYRVVSHERVGDLETWGLFRDDLGARKERP